MKYKEVPITREGLAEVEQELHQLITIKRPDIVAKIKAAREHGDLSENFEYHAARNEQAFVEARIKELEAIVRHHVLVESNGPADKVEVLSTVTFAEEGGDDETYRVVPPTEADPTAGRISYESAIGAALIGRRVGDEVEVQAPSGSTYSVRILKIE
jgi:transcription elongation factor GreA